MLTKDLYNEGGMTMRQSTRQFTPKNDMVNNIVEEPSISSCLLHEYFLISFFVWILKECHNEICTISVFFIF